MKFHSPNGNQSPMGSGSHKSPVPHLWLKGKLNITHQLEPILAMPLQSSSLSIGQSHLYLHVKRILLNMNLL